MSVADHYPTQRARTLEDRYTELVDQAVLAEQLGYDSFLVAEHHFHEYGAVPSPPILLAMIAARTSRIRLGPAVSVLPFRNPVQVAEDYAMLDRISGGRMRLGAGSGYLQHEFDGFGVDPAEKRFRFDESLEVIQRAWTGERFSFDGEHVKVDDIRLNVTPMQTEPHTMVAVIRPEAAYHVGLAGRAISLVPYAATPTADDLVETLASYRRGWADGAHEGASCASLALHTYAADTDEAARREVHDAFELYVTTRLYAKQRSYEELNDARLVLFGSSATLTERLRWYRDIGADEIMLLADFGCQRPEVVTDTLTQIAEDVAPKL